MASETWVLKWQFSSTDLSKFTINFTSAGQEFTALSSSNGTSWIVYYTATSSVKVCDDATWSDDAYRTLAFSTAPTGELLTWLQANGTKQVPKVTVDLTSLSGYESLPAGTYALAVKAKAANYQDSYLSSTVNFTKLAAPVATAANTTVTWDAITNAESYDVYVDGELYENTTGAIEYNVTIQGVNGGYISDGTTAAFVKVNSDTVSSTNYDFMFSSRSTASHSVKASKIALLGGDTIPDSDYSLDGTNYTELSGTTPTVIPITQDCTIYVKTYQVE